MYIPPVEPDIGDVNSDGYVDAVDAAKVLKHYAAVSTGKDGYIPKEMQKYADLDENWRIDAVDAAAILGIYSKRSVLT